MLTLRPKRRWIPYSLALISIITMLGPTQEAFGNGLPPNFTANGYQFAFQTNYNSQNGGNTYVQYNGWYYVAQSTTSCTLTNLGYAGSCVGEAFLLQGEISAHNPWCSDTGGLGDPNGPSMLVNGQLSTQGVTDIVSNSPSSEWSDIPQGTVTITVQSPDGYVSVAGSYDVYQVTGHLDQNTAYKDFTFRSALNGGSCPSYAQAATYWDFGQALYSGASQCCWPRTTFTHLAQVYGNFWSPCGWFSTCYAQPEAGFYETMTGTG